MKIVSRVFSWLGGVVSVIIEFVYADIFNKTYYHNQAWWLFIVALGLTIFQVSILIYREIQISNGRKNASGVLTLLFVSLVGGILTLCIPEDQLY